MKKIEFLSDVTPRKREILKMVVDGLSYEEIAQVLKIGPVTVRNHVKELHERLKVRNKVELLRFFYDVVERQRDEQPAQQSVRISN